MTQQTAADAPDAGPRSARDLSHAEFRSELQTLKQSKLFWLGTAMKAAFAMLWGSHFATRWFAPFLYQFVHGRFADPWKEFLARDEPQAFPYGPGMLAITSLPWLPAYFTTFDPASHFGLLLLRIPVFVADLAILLLLMRWLRVHARDAVAAYWLSPVVIYGTYVHGQLDLIPTALLCIALYLMFAKRIVASAIVFGFALTTKGHLFIALPLVLVYLYRLKQPRFAMLHFAGVAALTALALYAVPLSSPAFRAMVLGNAESQKIWSVTVPYGGSGLVLYVAPGLILTAFLRFANYRKVNRELTLMFIGALYVALVALVPPQPGWFIWSIPFVAYLGARFTRTGRFVLLALSTAYLTYFFVGDPVVFLEALDPTFGAGFGARAAATLAQTLPLLFGAHAASIAWTFLFSATAIAGLEMYRKGVRSNAIYAFREQSFMIGMGGDSGAGKHTIARDLSSVMGAQLSVINGDDDHKWERGHAMWRRYTHLNPRGNLLAAQVESIAALRRGGDIQRRHYDHDVGKFTSPLHIKPNDFMSIVGLHPFYLPSQRELMHLKVYVDPDDELRRRWKVARDMAKRGYTEETVRGQIEERVADSVKYVRPQAKYADLVLRHGFTNDEKDVALELEMTTALEPFTLLDAVDAIESIEAIWTPDEGITRNRISIKGSIDAETVGRLGAALLPDADELVQEQGWLDGGRGMVQLAILHAIAVRLRTASSTQSGEL